MASREARASEIEKQMFANLLIGLREGLEARSRAARTSRWSPGTRMSGWSIATTTAACGCCTAATTSSTAATGWDGWTPACSSLLSSGIRAPTIPIQTKIGLGDALSEYVQHTGSALPRCAAGHQRGSLRRAGLVQLNEPISARQRGTSPAPGRPYVSQTRRRVRRRRRPDHPGRRSSRCAFSAAPQNRTQPYPSWR
jgi:hypothetical protein